MDEKQAELEMQLRQLGGKVLDGKVEIMLLDLEMEVRKAYPNIVDVKPHARKIVAYLREHLVK
jgi:hypothetical protein